MHPRFENIVVKLKIGHHSWEWWRQHAGLTHIHNNNCFITRRRLRDGCAMCDIRVTAHNDLPPAGDEYLWKSLASPPGDVCATGARRLTSGWRHTLTCHLQVMKTWGKAEEKAKAKLKAKAKAKAKGKRQKAKAKCEEKRWRHTLTKRNSLD